MASTGSTSDWTYAPAPESRAILDLKSSYGLFVNGEFVDGTGTAFKTISPATEEVAGRDRARPATPTSTPR